jgi:hypothetical protein
MAVIESGVNTRFRHDSDRVWCSSDLDPTMIDKSAVVQVNK